MDGTACNNSSTSDVENMCVSPVPESEVNTFVQKTVPPVILCLGTLGNLLCIAVMLKPKNRRNSTSLFLLALAVSDLVILWSGLCRRWIKFLWRQDIRQVNAASCKIMLFLVHASISFSSWVLVAVTVERVLCVIYPHRVKIVSTRKNAIRTLAAMGVAVCCLNIHFVFGMGISNTPDCVSPRTCQGTTEVYSHFVSFVFPWLDFAVTFLAPFLILLTGNIIILTRLSKRAEFRARTTNVVLAFESAGIRSLGRLTLMLISAFLISMTPAAISVIIVPLIARTENLTQQQVVNLKVWKEIAILFMYTNASCNFYLYCLNGSRFRQDVKDVLLCRWRTVPQSVARATSRETERKTIVNHDVEDYDTDMTHI